MIGEGWKNFDIASEEDFSDLFEGTVEAPVEQPVVEPTEEGKTEPEVPKLKDVDLDSEEAFGEIFDEDDDEQEGDSEKDIEGGDVTKKVKPAAKENNDETKAAKIALLKATALYKAEKYGIELDDSEEWDEDRFAEFEDELDEFRLEERYNQLKESDPNIKAVLEVAEAGTGLKGLAGLFTQKTQLDNIDTSTLQGKIDKITAYYRDVEGKPDAWIKRQLRLWQTGETTDEIEEEFKLVEAQYDEYFEQEKQEEVRRATELKAQREANIQKRVQSFSQTLETKSFNKKEAEELTKFVFDNSHTIKNSNRTYTLLDIEMLRRQQDPEKLADVALFLKDQKLYDKRVIAAAKNVANTSKFKNLTGEVITTKPVVATNEKRTKFQFITK